MSNKIKDKDVREILKQLIDQLAPEDMPKPEVAKLRKATGFGESTIRNARKREALSGDTLIRLLLAHGVDPREILNLPRKKPSKVCPTITKWHKLGLTLTELEREAYSDLINWNKKKFTPKK